MSNDGVSLLIEIDQLSMRGDKLEFQRLPVFELCVQSNERVLALFANEALDINTVIAGTEQLLQHLRGIQKMFKDNKYV
jgi:hypothetical protein